jgi:hypothetical protein
VSLAEFAMKKSACSTQVTSPQNGKVLQLHGKLFQITANPYRTTTLLRQSNAAMLITRDDAD